MIGCDWLSVRLRVRLREGLTRLRLRVRFSRLLHTQGASTILSSLSGKLLYPPFVLSHNEVHPPPVKTTSPDACVLV